MVGNVVVVVVREGIDGGPEANPVPHPLQDISPDGRVVP